MSQNVVITGAASGLGKALALRYAGPDVKICVADINFERGQEVVDQAKQKGAEAFYQSCDITNQKDIDDLAEALKAHWDGQIDILVNNAGVATGGGLGYEDIEQWQWVFNINLFGAIRICRTLVPLMQARSQGTILNIASQAGLTPAPLMGSYNASKAATISFSETMHLELARDNIHVCVACPSFFATNLGESLRSTQPGLDKSLGRFLNRPGINADQVADLIYRGVAAKNFMIVTHKEGRMAFRLKNWLPLNRYLKMMKEKTKNFGNIK